MRHLALLCLAVSSGGLALAACADRPVEPTPIDRVSLSAGLMSGGCPYYDANPNAPLDADEELFGAIAPSLGFQGSAVLTDRFSVQVRSVPLNFGSPCTKSVNGPGHANEGAEFGWFSPFDTNYHCDESERHREEGGGDFESFQELHCLSEAEVVLVVGGSVRTSRPLDFIRYHAALSVPADSLEASDRTAVFYYDASGTGVWPHRDLIVDYSDSTYAAITPAVQISPKPAALLQSNKWRSQQTVGGELHVPSNYHLRVNAWASTALLPGRTLVRYFWNYGADNSESGRTGFVNVSLSSGEAESHVRTHLYPAAGLYRLVAHLIQPNEMPMSGYDPLDIETGTADTVMIRVHEPLSATIDVSPAAPHFTGTLLTFTAGGGNGGGGVTYIWTFGDGTSDSTTGAVVTHSYATTGTKNVTLVKRDQYGYAQGSVAPLQVTQALNVLAVANNDELSNFVKPNQTCLWRAQSNISNPVTSYTWQYATKFGGWAGAGSGSLLSLATGSQQTTKPYRVIGVNGAQADTFNFDIVITNSGFTCSGW